jgi:hypothetical protein
MGTRCISALRAAVDLLLRMAILASSAPPAAERAGRRTRPVARQKVLNPRYKFDHPPFNKPDIDLRCRLLGETDVSRSFLKSARLAHKFRRVDKTGKALDDKGLFQYPHPRLLKDGGHRSISLAAQCWIRLTYLEALLGVETWLGGTVTSDSLDSIVVV